MNIEDFKKDAENLISVYEQRGEEYYEYLKTWLQVRKYDEKELEFMALIISRSLINPKSRMSKNTHYNFIRAHLELLGDILPNGSYPISFDDVKGEFLRSREKFMLAEKWAFQLGYIDQNGKWCDKKGALGAFLRWLRENDVIRKDKNTVKYLIDRYGIDDISEQLKSAKAKPFEERLVDRGIEVAVKFPKNR